MTQDSHGHDKPDHVHEHEHDHARERGSHSHSHSHPHGSQAPEAIARAMAVTVLFMLIEAAGGWVANSLALLSDAAHMLTDIGAMLLSLFAIWVSRRPSNSRMTFGYHRAEILGALASGLTIWLLAGVLVYESIHRLQNPQEVSGGIVFVVASVGLAANLLSMRMLRHAQHHNLNAKGAYLHMLSDALGSIGAIIAGAVLYFTHWRPIDPIVTIFFSILMLVSSWELVGEAVGVLMESTPAGVDFTSVLQDLQGIEGVREAHDLHIWSVSVGRLALSVHLVAEDAREGVLQSAIDMLEQKYEIIHTTIQIERPENFRSDRCYDCAPPRPDAR